MTIYEKAPAKINLTLDVLGKRDDGYHEVEMIMTMVDLSDRLELEELSRDTIIISSPVGYIPLDEKNLAFQAAKLIKERYKVKQGVYIHIDKKIPVSAGLGGGSSDAAATLRGLNRLWKLHIDEEELQAMAVELGSDVPFCVTGGTALAKGRGEQLEKIPSPPACWAILARPQVSVSTAEIYRQFDATKTDRERKSQLVKQAIERQHYEEMCAHMNNMLEEVTLRLYPEVARIKDCMQRLGADGVQMTGSGPTVFGLVKKESKINKIYNGLRGFCKEVHVVRILS